MDISCQPTSSMANANLFMRMAIFSVIQEPLFQPCVTYSYFGFDTNAQYYVTLLIGNTGGKNWAIQFNDGNDIDSIGGRGDGLFTVYGFPQYSQDVIMNMKCKGNFTLLEMNFSENCLGCF